MNTVRLKPIQKVASGREDRALDGFLQSQKRLAEAQQRLDELCNYQRSYAQPLRHVAPAMLANRQAFLDKLHGAIEFQRKQIAQAQAACEVERARWLLASRDVRVLDRLSECYHAREQRASDRVLQNEQDDRTAATFVFAATLK